MTSVSSLLLSLALSLFSLLSVQANAAPTASPPTAAFNSTVFALVYGAPLLDYYKTVTNYHKDAPANTFANAKSFVNATSQTVVESNVDTLYSFMAVDLSSANLAISLPNISPDQYFLLSFFDAYGDNFASLGRLHNTTEGTYLLRVANGSSAPVGGQQAMTVDGTLYQGVINYPGTMGLLLIRWLVANESSYAPIAMYQNATTVTTISQPSRSSVTLDDVLAFKPSGNQADDVLNLTALLAPSNPPEASSNLAAVYGQLAAAGVVNGTYTPESGIDLTLANATATALSLASLLVPGVQTTLNNGWKMINTSIIGNYEGYFGLRALLGSTAYLAVRATDALYPFHGSALDSTSTLQKNQSYLYTFSGKPPLQSPGFWSITAYNSSGYLIDNPENVYALGDRSNLTYPDGSLVYGGSNSSSSSQEFQILVQAADVPPPANWTSNWLPGPVGGGDFKALLRAYGPGDGLLDGTYQFPVVTVQAAITNSSSSGGGSGSGGSSGSGSSGNGAASLSSSLALTAWLTAFVGAIVTGLL